VIGRPADLGWGLAARANEDRRSSPRSALAEEAAQRAGLGGCGRQRQQHDERHHEQATHQDLRVKRARIKAAMIIAAHTDDV